MLPTELCTQDPRGNRTTQEIFASGTQPTEYCNVHREILIDASTNMRAGDGCPADLIQRKVGIVRPVPCDAEGDIRDRWVELTPSMLYGPECTYHNFNSNYNFNLPNDFNGDTETYPGGIDNGLPGPEWDEPPPDGGNDWPFVTEGLQ